MNSGNAPGVAVRTAPHLLIVDGSNLAHRAFWTLGGADLNALPAKVGNMLSGLARRWRATHMIMALDAAESFRRVLIPGYKADRKGRPGPSTGALTASLRGACDAWGLATREADGMEADDVIASLVSAAKLNGVPVSVVSRDSDLLQLVDDARAVRVLWPRTAKEGGGELIADAERVGNITGAEFGKPLRPDQLLDLRAMAGGKDNLPRIGASSAVAPQVKARGLTPRRAAALLACGATLDALAAESAWLLKAEEQGWVREGLADALARRDALRLRSECVTVANGGHSSLAKVRFGW